MFVEENYLKEKIKNKELYACKFKKEKGEDDPGDWFIASKNETKHNVFYMVIEQYIATDKRWTREEASSNFNGKFIDAEPLQEVHYQYIREKYLKKNEIRRNI